MPVSAWALGWKDSSDGTSCSLISTSFINGYRWLRPRSAVRKKTLFGTVRAKTHLPLLPLPWGAYQKNTATLFDSPAISLRRPLDFASPPHDGFALFAAPH